MRRRSGFTLIEVMVALVVTGAVVTLAYAALQAGLDTSARASRHRERTESAVAVRAMINDALRHAIPGIRGGPEVFQLIDRGSTDGVSHDSVAFATRGVEAPFGTGAPWQVDIWQDGDSLSLYARPAGEDPGRYVLRTSLGGVTALDVEVLARSTDRWASSWSEPSIAPEAVRLSISGAAGQVSGVPLVVRIGLERTP